MTDRFGLGILRARGRIHPHWGGRVARVLAMLMCCGMAAGQPEVGPGEIRSVPEGPRRILRVFSFDEPDNPDPVPPQWQRTTVMPDGGPREGFPKFNLAVLDNTVSKSGTTSVQLPTQGGCTALRLKSGEVPIFADADYAITAQVRTSGLEHARAFLTARLLDQRARVVPGSEVRSEPILTGGLWRPVSVRVPGGLAGAAWLQIDLELLQERQYVDMSSDDPAAKALAQHKVWREDVRGAAWFDDVSVLQIPQATLTTTSPRNIVIGDDPATLVMTVRDLGGDALRARVRVRDLSGTIVAEHQTPIDPGGRPVQWTPRLPGFGWFNAQMDVIIQPPASDPEGMETEVSRGEVRFIRIPAAIGRAEAARASGATGPRKGTGEAVAGQAAPARTRAGSLASADAARFGIIAEATPADRLGDLPDLLQRLGTRFVYLPAWTEATTTESAAQSLKQRRAALESLLRNGQTITLSMDGVPGPLSRTARIAADDALALAGVSTSDWVPYLSPTLDIFGQRVLRYQFGGTGNDHAFWKRTLAPDLATLDSALSSLVPGPTISIPWIGDRAWPPFDSGDAAYTVDAVTLEFPLAFPPGAVGETLGAFRPSVGSESAAIPTTEVTVVPELPEAGRFGPEAAVTELARRVVEFWRVAGDDKQPKTRLAIHRPWDWSEDSTAQIWPRPESAALVTLMDRLGGRRIVGELRGTPGVKCYILAARNSALNTLERGALVAWNESADPGSATVEAAAAETGLTVVDIFGNGRSIADGNEAGSTQAGPLVSVPVGETPVFVEGIDPYLALFTASFRLEPTFMPAVVREHEHRIILSNPWPVRITGKLQLKEDRDRNSPPTALSLDEWRVSPSGIVDFDMAPGQTLSVPVTLWFGAGQLAGTKEFVIVAKAMADRSYPPVRLKTAIEIGLEDIHMEPELQPPSRAGSNDVVVVASVTNRGSRPRTLRLETAARNLPSQQLQISDLPPGQTVLRRFVFKDAAQALSGRRIVISLTDNEEAQRLNKAVLVP